MKTIIEKATDKQTTTTTNAPNKQMKTIIEKATDKQTTTTTNAPNKQMKTIIKTNPHAQKKRGGGGGGAFNLRLVNHRCGSY